MLEEIDIQDFEYKYGNKYSQVSVQVNRSMITDNELRVMKTMWNYKKPINAMEIGIRKGFTAQFLMENSPWLNKYIGVDVPNDFHTTLEEQNQEVEAEKAVYIKDIDLLDLRILPRGSFDIKVDDLPKLDFVFIDGDHSTYGVINDSLLAIKSLNQLGIIFWHDYQNVKSVSESICFLKYKFNWNIKHIKGTYLCYLEN